MAHTKELATIKPTHSPIGASSMYRWAECPGSVALSATVPPQESSAYAEEGTEAHELAAKWLTSNGKTPDCDDDEMLDNVRVYVDYVYGLLGSKCKLFVEHGFDLSDVYPGAYGTNDAAVYDGVNKILHVIDLKYGAGIYVSARNNPQLRYYALGALLELQKEGHEVETVVMTIVQPRCTTIEGPARSETIDAVDLMEFAADLVMYAKRTAEPNAPLKAGDHCRFCPAINICPEVQNVKQMVAKSEFAAADEKHLVMEGTVPPHKLAEYLKAVPLLKAMIERIDAYAYAEARAGRPVPGYKLVEKRANRKWINETEVSLFLGSLKVSDDDIFEPRKIRTPAQMEKKLPSHYQMLTKFVTKESSGLVLVPEEDKRPAFKPDAKKEFAAAPVVTLAAGEGPALVLESPIDILGLSTEIIDPFAD